MRSDITPPSIQSPQARCPCRFDGKRNTNEATPKPVPPVAKADLPQKREATLAGNLARAKRTAPPREARRGSRHRSAACPFILSFAQQPAPHFVSFPARRQVSERRSLRRLVHRFLARRGKRLFNICSSAEASMHRVSAQLFVAIRK